jgi:diguanylate cyclase (GGDEF)-like protein
MSGDNERPEQPFGVPRGGDESDKGLAGQEADQTASDTDQTLSDADQTASDADQTGSERDQRDAGADQAASDRDQAASDRDLAAHTPTDAAFRRTYEASRAQREEGTEERTITSELRTRTMFERAQNAIRRDQSASLRDTVANARDLAAEARDRAEEMLERVLGTRMAEAAKPPAEGAADRARAADDRARAADDRFQATRDREQAYAEIERAQLDDLTGFYRRGPGRAILQQEIDRSQRSDGRLVLAYIDVDGLKQVNDERGHLAGDQLLKDVAGAMRSRLRSYDPVVRLGGDEFVCMVSETDLETARDIFKNIQKALAARQKSASMSVGLAALRADDSLETLMARGDAALLRTRATSPVR